MLAEELIYNLRTNLAQRDSSLLNKTDQHLMYMLNAARSVLIGRKLQNGNNLEGYQQFLDLTPVVASSDIVGTINAENVYYVEPPKPIFLAKGPGITTVGSTDGEIEYASISYGRVKTILYKKYTSTDPKWFYDEGKILLINRHGTGLTKVRVRGFFDDPYAVVAIKTTINPFRPYDWEYPLSNKDADALYSLAMSSDLGWGDTAMQVIAKQDQDQARRQAEAQQQARDAEGR